MTIGEKMHSTLMSLQEALTDMKSFAMETQDQSAKKMFDDYANKLDSIVQGFKGRVNTIESQEPQYKVRS